MMLGRQHRRLPIVRVLEMRMHAKQSRCDKRETNGNHNSSAGGVHKA